MHKIISDAVYEHLYHLAAIQSLLFPLRHRWPYSLFWSFRFLPSLPQTIKLFVLPIFDFERTITAWVQTTAGRLLVPDSITWPVKTVFRYWHNLLDLFVIAHFIRYLYFYRKPLYGLTCVQILVVTLPHFYVDEENFFSVPDLGQMRSCASYVMKPLTWASKEVDPVSLHRHTCSGTPTNLKLHHISINPS